MIKLDILNLVNNKKQLFIQELAKSVKALEDLKSETSSAFEERSMKAIFSKLPMLKSDIVAYKLIVQSLIELENEINSLEE